MPNDKPAELRDIERKDRAKLNKWLMERCFIGYGLSYSKLKSLLCRFIGDDEVDEAIQDCVLAFDDATCKDVVDGINKEISSILLNNGLQGLRFHDQFNRQMTTTLYESSSGSRLNKDKMVELGPSIGISTDKVMKLIEISTTPGKSYTALRVQAVKE